MIIDLTGDYLKLEAVAQRLGFPNRGTALNLITKFELLPLYRLGERGIYAKRTDVEAFLKQHGPVQYERRKPIKIDGVKPSKSSKQFKIAA
jgi:diacylglycerol kinase family enzyme